MAGPLPDWIKAVLLLGAAQGVILCLALSARRKGASRANRLLSVLMRVLGLAVIYRKPRSSIPGRQHKRYPYLLNGVVIVRPNQVWSADITYERLAHGFVYLVAIINWYSRSVLCRANVNRCRIGLAMKVTQPI